MILAGTAALFLVPAAGQSQFPQGPGGPPGGGPPGGGFRGGFDPNQFWNMLSGGKSVIDRNSLDPRMQGWFDRMAERAGITDGKMTKEQFDAYQQRRMTEGFGGGRGGPPGSPPGTPGAPAAPGAPEDRRGGPSPDQANSMAENFFHRYDLNGDGYLNNDEMPEALRIEREKFDTDRNGLIDLNEFKAYFQARMQSYRAERDASRRDTRDDSQEDEPKKPVVYRAGTLPKGIPAWFAQLDSDGDAQIGLYEWKNSGRPLEEFFKYDRNNDGFVTVDEVMYFVAQNGEGNGGDERSGGFPGSRGGMAMGGPGSPWGGSPGMGGPGGFGGFGRPGGFGMPGGPGGMMGRGDGTRNMRYLPPGGGDGGRQWPGPNGNGELKGRGRFGGGPGGDNGKGGRPKGKNRDRDGSKDG
jgi:Ca2+-binding EF-hand superfamily protein